MGRLLKLNYDHQHAEQQTAGPHLDFIARKAWEAYRAEVLSELKPFSQRIELYFREREESGVLIPLNSHIPVLLAEVFRIIDERKVSMIATGHLYLDTFTQVLDDATDKVYHDNNEVHLSHILLMRGLERLRTATSDSRTAGEKIRQGVEDTMAAERILWVHRERILEYNEDDYGIIARRGGILRCAVRAYAALAEDDSITDKVEHGLLQGALAIQLLDDLVDWQEDFKDKIYTPLLSKAISFSGNKEIPPAFDEVAQAFITSGAIEDTIRRAVVALADGMNIFHDIGGRSLSRLYGTLLSRVERLQETLTPILANPLIKTDAERLAIWLNSELDSRFFH